MAKERKEKKERKSKKERKDKSKKRRRDDSSDSGPDDDHLRAEQEVRIQSLLVNIFIVCWSLSHCGGNI